MQTSNFQLEDRGNGHFALSGDMSFATANAILRSSEDEFRRHASLKIDLAGVDKADSAGLALMLEWKSQALRRTASIEFSGVPDSLVAIASTCEVDTLI